MKIKLSITISISILILSSLVLFAIYRTQFFEYTTKSFAFCPKDPIVCDMRKLEEIVPCEKYSDAVISPGADGVLVGDSPETTYLLMKFRVEYMFVDTREDLQGGVINYGEPLVNNRVIAPAGFYFKYPLQGLIKTRTYSKCIRIKMNEFVDDERLASELKSYGSAVYPQPRKY